MIKDWRELRSQAENTILKIGLSTICIVVSLALSAAILIWVLQIPSGKAKVQMAANLETADSFQMNVNNRISASMEGVASFKKMYWIGDNSVPPKPNKKCFGETEDPSSLQWLIDEAEPLLEGQELFFHTDVEILKDSTVHYYLDDTIFSIAWKEVKNDSVLTYAETKILHPSQFRRFLSDGQFGSGTLYLTTEMAESVNAVTACSADYYAYRTEGITVTEGTVRRNNGGNLDICYIDRAGDMNLVRGSSFDTSEKAQKYMDEHSVNFSLAFGPILVKDGEQVQTRMYPLGEIHDYFTRAALCQMDRLHYLYIAVNAESGHYHLPEINEFASWAYETGCMQAYTLDGGQTATVVMKNELVNHVNYGSQRRISDIIYFATALPEGG